NYLAALHWPAGREAALALAWTDISTGAVAVLGTKASQWIGDMQRLRPREVLVPAGRLSEIAGHDQVSEAGIVLTPLAESQYHGGRGARRLCEIYGVAQLDGLGDYSAAEVSALAALLDYVALTQKGALPTLRPPVRERSEDLLAIDAGTRSNLELLETQTRERKGSLLWAIDCTVSKPGSRLLGAWLASPLANKARIEERLAATRYFFFEADLRKTIRLRLTGLPDLARSLSRLTLNRGGPRDLALVADAVIAAQEAARALIAGAAESRQALPERLGALIRHLTGPDGAANDLAADLKSGLVPTPPVTPREGKFVERDYDETLEATRALRENSRAVLGELEKRYKEETGIGSLKIKHNNVLGYFIEVSAAQGERLLKAEGGPLAHRQTLANAIRFTSEELNALAGDIEAAQAKALGLERAHFDRWVAEVGALAPVLSLMAEALAELDGLTALADLAQTRSYVEPTLDASPVFEVEDGRHPVVEAMLREQGEAFVANDCKLNASGEAERL
ncbi:MAG: DNA mismatch repair protein MutS, partial [Pseudomonadota bacterium]